MQEQKKRGVPTANIGPRHDEVGLLAENPGREITHAKLHGRDGERVDIVEPRVAWVAAGRRAVRRAAAELASIAIDLGRRAIERCCKADVSQ